MRNGWGTIYSAYEGACNDYQHFYRDDYDCGYVNRFNNDGDWGYGAYVTEGECEWKYIGRFDSREAAQMAIEEYEFRHGVLFTVD